MSPKKERIIFLDYLRVFAIISVLLCHSTQAIYVFETDYVKSISAQSKYMLLTLFTCGRMFGVPIFLMITGYLLLGKEYNDEKIVRFWKNSWLHLVICTMIWFLYGMSRICRLRISSKMYSFFIKLTLTMCGICR